MERLQYDFTFEKISNIFKATTIRFPSFLKLPLEFYRKF